MCIHSGRAVYTRTRIHNFCQFTLIKRPLFAAGPPPRARSVSRPPFTPVAPALRPPPMRTWRPLAVGCYRAAHCVSLCEPHDALAPATRRPLTFVRQAHII